MSDPRDQLDLLLPPDPGAGRTDPLPAIPAGAVPADLPKHLRDRLDEAPGADRSAQTAGLVAAAVEWGLDDGEVVAVAMAHRPTREKYGKRVEREAVRLLGKFRPDHQHVGRPCDRAGCPNAPRWMTGLGPSMVEGKTDCGGLVEGSSSVGEQSEFGEQRSAEADDPPERPGLSSPDSLSSPSREETWPELDPAALHGLAGRLVATLGPHTEADPAALLLSFLVAFGNAVGPGPRALVGATEHPARLNLLLVGQTARARKGTAQAEVNKVMSQADPGWFAERVVGGLASGEGLIATVRDPADDEDTDAPADKRLLCVEAEFVRVLGVAAREGNTLSAVLRQAWDDGRLRTMTRKDPLRASGAHISIIGHITAEELLRRLGDTEIANGFVNRFLLAAVRRSKRLPEGGSLDPAALDELAADVAEALGKARKVGTVTRSPGARERWAKAYEDFGDGADGLAGALTARPEAQTLRLSVAYALLDGSAVVELPHLEAALAVWRYCEASAYAIFGDLLGDPVADRLLDELRQAGPEGLDGAAQHAVFARKVTATRLAQARALLEGKGLASTTSEKTGGRDRLITRINRRDNR